MTSFYRDYGYDQGLRISETKGGEIQLAVQCCIGKSICVSPSQALEIAKNLTKIAREAMKEGND
jgi:hypothetical protein